LLAAAAGPDRSVGPARIDPARSAHTTLSSPRFEPPPSMRSSDRVSFVSSPHTMDQPPNGFAAGGACEIKSLFPSPVFIIFFSFYF